uniref:hypothetical protein n=1 Tax=Paractinoplanes polyasparticus TaxID=2856853 RepID=UPI001C863C31|nr:hypothetical protein [Actinoplanes polyasparticus]
MNRDLGATDDHIQQLITLLLDRAIVASHTLALLHTLADTDPHGGSSARADIAQAITAMQGAGVTLVRNADQLAQLLHSRQTRP